MADFFTLPSSSELMEIEQDYRAEVTAEDPIFKFLPPVTHDTAKVQWEQRDNFTGMQQVRGLNGQPPVVGLVGASRWEAKPSFYGETLPLDEAVLMEARELGSYGTPKSLDKWVAELTLQANIREWTRIRNTLWTLVSTGKYQVTNRAGIVLGSDDFPIQKYAAAYPWSNLAQSTPLADLRYMATLAAGHSTRFDSGAAMFMNRVQIMNLLNNKNPNDLGGLKLASGMNVVSIDDLNKVFLANDLPSITPMNDGWYDDTNTFNYYLGTGRVVVIGPRMSGVKVGEYQMVRNVNNPGFKPGPYLIVSDSLNGNGTQVVPRRVTVDKGHNGGPAIQYPSSVVAIAA